ncbi:MAG TPA: LacI family DNA-binding transcriptional regulator [Candidatus Limnocylindrales bacterium]
MTIGNVAKAAGVSRATASRVVSGSGHIGAHARQVVEKVVQDLDFSVEAKPRVPKLAYNAVGVVVTESTTKMFRDPFFSPLMRGIYTALAERSILLLMLALNSNKDMEMAEAYLSGNHMDGAILVSLHGDNQMPRHLHEQGLPMVVCGRPPKGLTASYVDCDNRQGGAMAVEHLIAQGRRRIATIAGNLDMPSAVDRLAGYRDALTAAGIPLDPTLEEVADYQPDRAHMAMERLLLNHPDVDAVFAASDLMASAAMRVLHQSRKRIPEDVAVIGFDDSPDAWVTRPPLSSVRQPIEEMGHEAVNVLMRTLAEPDEAPRQVIFATELVIRDSTVGSSAGRPASIR